MFKRILAGGLIALTGLLLPVAAQAGAPKGATSNGPAGEAPLNPPAGANARSAGGAQDAPTAMLRQLAANTGGFKDYMLNCGGCHRYDGAGVAHKGIPDFRHSIGTFTQIPEGRQYMIRVPGAAQSLIKNADLARVLNWVVATFSPEEVGADFKPFTASEVGAVRPYRFDDVAAERARIEGKLAEHGLQAAPYQYGKNWSGGN